MSDLFDVKDEQLSGLDPISVNQSMLGMADSSQEDSSVPSSRSEQTDNKDLLVEKESLQEADTQNHQTGDDLLSEQEISSTENQHKQEQNSDSLLLEFGDDHGPGQTAGSQSNAAIDVMQLLENASSNNAPKNEIAVGDEERVDDDDPFGLGVDQLEPEEREATPVPVPEPVQSDLFAPISEPRQNLIEQDSQESSPVVGSIVADSTTPPAPSSDDRPVKMPKATTIATPSKTAPRTSSSSCSSGCLSAWLKQLDPRVWDVVMWRDPRVSGVVLFAIMFILMSLARCSVFSVISNILLLVLCATLSVRIVKAILVRVHKGDDVHPFKDLLEADFSLSEELVEDYTRIVVQRLNIFIAELKDLLLVQKVIPSLKLALVLYAMSYIGAWFNGLTIVILAVAAVFTMPKVYEVNKAKIDMYVDMAQSKYDDYYKLLQEKVPYLKKQKTQ